MPPSRSVAHDVVSPGSATRGVWRTPGGARATWLAAGLAWLCALGYGARTQFLHATTRGDFAAAPTDFPTMSRLPRAHDRSTLYMFVHPECACTRASLHELGRLLAQHGEHVLPVLVVERAPGGEALPDDSPVAAFERARPGLSAVSDDGDEALRFGAHTSGHVVLYDRQGTLRFAGGITGSRGHEGENAGLEALRSALRPDATGALLHAVFGCAFADPPEKT